MIVMVMLRAWMKPYVWVVVTLTLVAGAWSWFNQPEQAPHVELAGIGGQRLSLADFYGRAAVGVFLVAVLLGLHGRDART